MNPDIILSEVSYKTARSGGKGGQHVNKVSSKVILQFEVSKSEGLNAEEIERIQRRLSGIINKEGFLIIHCETTRSQLKNKRLAEERLIYKIKEALYVQKKRLKVKPSKAQVEKRLKAKKINSEKKSRRRDDNI